jgi:enoyl-CoA hydratase
MPRAHVSSLLLFFALQLFETMYTYIKTEEQEGILTISINREDKLNALNAQVLQEIKDAVEAGIQSNEVYGMIISGSGDKAFAAGADISEFAHFDQPKGKELSAAGHEVMNAIENSPKVIIAAVKGYALGGGCELAMACHMRISGENGKFGQPEVNLGLPPGYGATQRLVQLVGKGKAIELLTTANIIDAQEALRLNLVNAVVPVSEVLDTAQDWLKKIAKKSPQAVRMVLDCVRAYYSEGTEKGLETEIHLFGESFQTEEFVEGTSAFLEKRKADFRK